MSLKQINLEKELGSIIYGVVAKSFIDQKNKKGKIRIKPINGQGFPENILISCSRAARESYPVGTRFKLDVKVCQKSDGKFYLNSTKTSVLKTEEEYGKDHPMQQQLYFDF